MKLGNIKGEATDADHDGWIIIEHCSAPISRTIPMGAKDQQRTKGETSLADVTITRQVDKSSTKLMETCANGTFYLEVELHFCTTVKNKHEPYMKYKLSDVIVSHHSVRFTSDGVPLPKETISLGYTKAEWTYIVVDPKTGDKKAQVPTKYNPGQGRS